LFVETLGVECDQRVRPVERLADGGRLPHFGVAQLLNKLNSLLCQLRTQIRNLEAYNRKLFL
jgi:hypothetical protein